MIRNSQLPSGMIIDNNYKLKLNILDSEYTAEIFYEHKGKSIPVLFAFGSKKEGSILWDKIVAKYGYLNTDLNKPTSISYVANIPFTIMATLRAAEDYWYLNNLIINLAQLILYPDNIYFLVKNNEDEDKIFDLSKSSSVIGKESYLKKSRSLQDMLQKIPSFLHTKEILESDWTYLQAWFEKLELFTDKINLLLRTTQCTDLKSTNITRFCLNLNIDWTTFNFHILEHYTMIEEYVKKASCVLLANPSSVDVPSLNRDMVNREILELQNCIKLLALI